MKLKFILVPLVLSTVGSCALLFSTNKFKGNVKVDLTELPQEEEESLKNNFQISSINRDKNEISLNSEALNSGVNAFISTAILNDDIHEFDFYLKQSLPRVRYWEYIVNQLPDYVDYGFKYDSYSDKSDDKGQMLAFLSYRLNRDSKNIAMLFAQTKETIYKTITKKKYVDYGLEGYVNSLILNYEHLRSLPDYAAQMKRIYAEVLVEDKNSDIFGRTSNQYPIYAPIVNDAIKTRYQGSNGMVLNDYGQYTDMLWFHSFWVRRYNEGNSTIVYGILNEIQQHYAALN